MHVVKMMFGRQKRRPIKDARVAELLAHLDAAYMLARCMTEDECSAEAAVHEAFLYAFRNDCGAGGAELRVWLLTTVRNTCLDRRRRDQLMARQQPRTCCCAAEKSDAVCVQERNAPPLEHALYSLAPESREVVLLRELHDLSYGEIAKIVGVPVGTVMSRLSRARTWVQQNLLSGHEAAICAQAMRDERN